MNNETISSLSSQIIYETYLGVVELYIIFGCSTLLFYAFLLRFPDEVEYIWTQRLTLPTYLYLFSRYPAMFYFVLTLVPYFLPEKEQTLQLCSDLTLSAHIIAIFPVIGIQGLIAVRTHSLCRGYRPMMIALSTVFLAGLVVQIYDATVPICNPNHNPDTVLVPEIITDVAVVISDVLAFIAVIHQVWGLWRLKRSLGLQNNKDILTLLLKQGILRFCFALSISTVVPLLTLLAPNNPVAQILPIIQNTFSSLLLCEFTLDLRRRNATRTVPASDLQTLSFRDNPMLSTRSALGRFNDDIIAEMGERNDLVDVDD